MSKKAVIIILILAVVAGVYLCKGKGGDGDGPTKLKLSHPAAVGHPYDLAAKMFKKEVEEKTGGKYEITIFPANQLGNQEEVTEAAQVGTIDIVITSDDKLMSLVPEFGALGMPFLFSDFDHVYRTLNGSVGEMLSRKLETKGVIVISWLENGFRHITNNRSPVFKPDDVKGLKIRVSSAKTNMTLFDYCGAAVTNVSFSELYSALQLGTVEAQENPLPNILDKKFYEVQNYLSLSSHVHTAEPMIISRATFNKLSAEDRKIFSDAGKAASKWAFEDAKSRNREQLEELRKHIEINEIDRDSFKEIVDRVYRDFEGQFGEIARAVKAL